jgi:hypothetical protein
LQESFLLSCAQVAKSVPDLPPSDLAGTAMARKMSVFKNRKCFFLKMKDLFFCYFVFSLTGSTLYAGSGDSFDKVVFLFEGRITAFIFEPSDF